jgi:hypothetical protein
VCILEKREARKEYDHGQTRGMKQSGPRRG